MNKVLIITSIKTGSGHRASSNAIEKKLIDEGFDTKQLNAFETMGKFGRFMEDSYIPIVTKFPQLFYILERFSEHCPDYIHMNVYHLSKKNLLKEIKDYNPDLIISVQCMFTKSISKLIKENHLNIPFYVGVIDLVDPPTIWQDKDADMTFVPTKTIRKDYISKGFDENKVLVSGFPVRDDIIVSTTPKEIGDKINILMVNASTNLNKNIQFLKEVSRLENVNIDFICGLDEKLYKTLNKLQQNKQINDNIHIHGFIDNMNEFMAKSHIILTKAGPNTIIESIRSGSAIVITGHIHGQEDKNYKYVVENGYGIKCEDPNRIYDELYELINTNKLKDFLQNIANHEINNGAEFIANYIKKTKPS